MARIYLLVKYNKKIYKKSYSYLGIDAYIDKHVCQKKVDDLNSKNDKKKEWYGFVKFDIMDSDQPKEEKKDS